MEVFVARQPIYDRNQLIIGYELLFRNDSNRNYSDLNEDSATAEVLINSYLNFDFNELTNYTYGFINFTEKLLLDGIPETFPPEKLVIEILETVNPTEDIIEACKHYRQLGYKIALDDFQMELSNPETLKILPFIDLIKVDFRITDKKKRLMIVKLKNYFNIKLLAEKVETLAEYEEVYNEGFDFFQGYFLQKPVTLSSHEIPVSFHSYMELIRETKKPEPNIELLAQIIENDLSLSYKLLKLINHHNVKEYKIQSIKQAIVRLGLNEFQRWLYIISLRDLNQIDQVTNELIQNSLIRGKFCELFAKEYFPSQKSSPYFLLGMFSLIDMILQVPMNRIVKNLPLQEDIVIALLGGENQYSDVLNIIIAIEHADWSNMNLLENKFQAQGEDIFFIFMNAIRWANQVNETQNNIMVN